MLSHAQFAADTGASQQMATPGDEWVDGQEATMARSS